MTRVKDEGQDFDTPALGLLERLADQAPEDTDVFGPIIDRLAGTNFAAINEAQSRLRTACNEQAWDLYLNLEVLVNGTNFAERDAAFRLGLGGGEETRRAAGGRVMAAAKRAT